MKEAPWYVYLLKCADNTFYAGITTELQRRVDEHNQDNKKSAKYTRVRRPVKLVYFEPCDTRAQAASREYQIRNLKRADKQALAASMEGKCGV